MSHPEPQEVAAVSVDDLDHERRLARQNRLARMLGRIGRIFTVTGVVTLLFVAFQLWGTGLQEAQAQAELRDDFAERLAQVAEFTEASALVDPSPPTPTTIIATSADAPATTASANEPARQMASTTTLHPSILPLLYPEGGEEVARIEIPSINVDKIVVEGVNVEDLRKGPGRYQRTSAPGDEGNTAVAGHRTTYGAPFHNIDNLAPGDEILVTSLLGQFTYRVVGQPEVDRVGFCREEGRTNNEELAAEASQLRAPSIELAELNASTTTTTTTLLPQQIPADFAVGAFDGVTYFSTTDVESELRRVALAQAEASAVQSEPVVAAARGAGAGAFDGIVDRPSVAGHFIVSPQDTCVLDDWGDNRLTLTACHPKFSARQRIVVVAELVGDAVARIDRPEVAGATDAGGLGADEYSEGSNTEQAAPGQGTPTTIARVAAISEDLDSGLGWDTSALKPAIAWGALAMAAYLAMQTLARRWRRWPSWALFTAPIAIPMFIGFQHLDRFLPAL